MELLKRRGKFQAEDFNRLKLTKKINLEEVKTNWLKLLETAEIFITERPPDELGALYYHLKTRKFFAPSQGDSQGKTYQLHFGGPGGVLPRVVEKS